MRLSALKNRKLLKLDSSSHSPDGSSKPRTIEVTSVRSRKGTANSFASTRNSKLRN